MALSLEEITNKAIIKFPWDLTLEQSQGLMNYISIKLKGYTTYEFLHSIESGYQFGYV